MLTIKEDEINQWSANEVTAESLLPDLIRRLIYSLVPPDRIKHIHFPSYKATHLGGYDGELETKSPTIFSDTLSSVWEISVRKDIGTKANSDYKTRTDDSKGKSKKDTTLIVVNGRSWPNKANWIKQKKKENQWADVRAFDATDLAQWLSQAPSVLVWFSSITHRPIKDIITADKYFEQWQYRTSPPLNELIPIAGRSEQVNNLYNWLRENPKSLKIRAETIEECIVFSCASILSADKQEKDKWVSQTIIVTSKTAWDFIVKFIDSSNQSSLILIPYFDEFDGSAFLSDKHHLLIPTELGHDRKKQKIELQAIQREKLAKVLTQILESKDKAKKIAYQSGGKITSLQRLLGYTHKIPAWVNIQNKFSIIPLLLAGAWIPAINNDKEIISDLFGGKPYGDIERLVNELMSTTDAPLRRQGEAIKWRSTNDAWRLLANKITAEDLQCFKTVCIKTLKQYDPKYDLPIKDRFYAVLKGKVLHESDEIRQGLSDTLAWLSIHCDEIDNIIGNNHVKDIVGSIIRTVLENDWKTWATLGSSLSSLAEASPEDFIATLKKVMRKSDYNFHEIFRQDPKNTSTYGGECCHSGLLWALETIAWHEDYFSQVAYLLAGLSELDKGGQYCNRPANSLFSIFHPIVRQTNASIVGRNSTLQALCKQYPTCGWNLLQKILDTYHRGDTVSCNSRPNFRDWTIPSEFEHIAPKEISDYFNSLRKLTLNFLEQKPELVLELLENNTGNVINTEILGLIELKIEVFRKKDWEFINRLQNSLRHLISFCYLEKEKKENNSSGKLINKAKKIIRNIGSNVLSEKYAWLFSNDPVLPESKEWDWNEKEKRIKSLRKDAIKNIIKGDNSLTEIMKLCELSEQSYIVGSTLSFVSQKKISQNEIVNNILSENVYAKEFAFGYISEKFCSKGFNWLKSIIENLIKDKHDKEAIEALTSVRSTPEIRKFIMDKPEPISNLYWQKVGHIFKDDIKDYSDFSIAIENLLKVNRWDAAIRLAQAGSRRKPEVGKTIDYLRILQHGLVASDDEVKKVFNGPLGARSIAGIFEHLDSCNDADIDELAKLEGFYIEIFQYSGKSPKYLIRRLEQSPEFFTELICCGFKASSEKDKELNDEEREKITNKANRAYEILSLWKSYPGHELEENKRDHKLREWCSLALELTDKADRKYVGQHKVGGVLSRVPPPKKDAIWPCLVAREYIENGYDEIVQGLNTANFNSRGVTTRALTSGGSQERDKAKSYRDNAKKIQYEYPQTSAFLINIAESYERDAKRHDSDSEKYVDP